MFEMIVLYVIVVFLNLPNNDCYVVYEYEDRYSRAKLIQNDVIVEVIAGGQVPDDLTCDNWDNKLGNLR